MMENIANILKVNSNNVKAGNEDYYKDGILMCGKCHTPKETYTFDNDGNLTVKVTCLCECENEALKEEKRKQREAERKEYMERMKNLSFQDEKSKKNTFANDDKLDPKLSNMMKNYVEHFEEMKNKGLLLFGTVGSGKTFYANCIANAMIEKGYTCMETNFYRISNMLFSNTIQKQEFINELMKYDLLIIDDLSAERDSEYMNEIVMNVINERYRSEKAIIITTNLTSEELKNPLTQAKKRIYSRLLEMCIPIEVKGDDRRKKKLSNDYKALMDILNS